MEPPGIDWPAVKIVQNDLAKVSVQIARVELGAIDAKVKAEKKKLNGLRAKHEQACDQLKKVRTTAQKEREKLLDVHNKLERDIQNLQEKPDAAERRNTLQVEMAQAKKQLETQKQQHTVYIGTHLATLKKRERLVVIQGKTIKNLLYRKLALAEKVHSQPDTVPREEPHLSRAKQPIVKPQNPYLDSRKKKYIRKRHS